MAKWENLKNAVAAVVKTNGNKEITGANMQAVLNSIINAVGGNAGFAGIATPTTNPSGIPDGPTFYIATQGGTYSYFPTDGQSTPATIQDGVISVLYNQGNGYWSVTTTPVSIADGSVTNAKLANGVVTTGKLANGAVTNDKIADGTIDGYLKIAESSIRWENMDQGSVGKDTLQDDAVIESKIKDGAVTEYKLGTSSVSQRSIINGAVTEAKLANNSVTGTKIANGTITSAKIADGTITGNEIAPNSIESSNLGYGSVDSDILADGAVTTDKLYNGAVTMRKLGEDVIDELDHKANNDGSYDTMSVGMAKNIEAEAPVTDTFAFNKSGGDTTNPATGICLLNKIYGNGAALSQLYPSHYDDNVPVPSVVARYRDDAQTEEMACYLCSEKVGDTYIRAIVTASEVATFFRSGSVHRNIIDLAVMYGITQVGFYYQLDNAPSTPAEFAAQYFKMFGNPYTYVAYGSQLLPTKMVGLKSVGFNQYKNDNQSIKVLGGKQYQITGTYTSIAIDGIVITPDNSGHFTPTIDSILVVTGGGADTCVHFAGDRDGQYEPYWERIFYLDVTQLFGTKSGGTEGHYYRFAKEGMCGAGTAQDVVELVGARGSVKIKDYNLGSLNYNTNNNIHYFYTIGLQNEIMPIQSGKHPNGISALFAASSEKKFNASLASEPLFGVSPGGALFVNAESNYNHSTSDFKTAMNGKYVSLALKTPLTFTSLFLSASSTSDELTQMPADAIPLDELTRSLMIDADGTMEVVMTSPLSQFPTSVAPTLEILYGLDAAKFITDAPKNYMSMASMDAFTYALGAAIGQTISKTWDSSNNRWNFTFTQNRSIEVEEQPEDNR